MHSKALLARSGLVLLLVASCGNEGAGGAGSSSAAPRSSAAASTTVAASTSAKPTTASSTSASTAPATSGAVSAAPAAAAAVTKEAFCDRLEKMSRANFAKCTKEDENTVSYLNFKKDIDGSKAECDKRIASTHVEFHPDVATACLAAAEKRGGDTMFFTLSLFPECEGVLTGKAKEGDAVTFGEECEAGLTPLKGKCHKPAAANAECSFMAGGVLGKTSDHPSCEAGLSCVARDLGEGQTATPQCVKGDVGAPCTPLANNCPPGSSCYQGKCRVFADVGGDCMGPSDCRFGTACHIAGGAFGKCEPLKKAGEACDNHEACISGNCRGKKCMSFCGSE